MARFETARALATIELLVIASLVRGAGAVVSGNDSSTPRTFNCTPVKRSYDATASTTWQFIEVRGTTTGDCATSVSFPRSAASDPRPPQQQLLLLKIDMLRLPPPGNTCQGNDTKLFANAVNPFRRTADVCSTGPSAAWYLWASEPLQLYMYVNPYTLSTVASSDLLADPLASFSLAYAVTSAINLCDYGNGSISVDVVNTSFAFASDGRYPQIPPNNITCSKRKYTLAMSAADASNQLSVTVLAAPRNGSCWTLSHSGRSCSDSDTYYALPGQTMLLVYSWSNFDGCVNETFNGFTISVSASSFDASQAAAAGKVGESNTSPGASVSASATSAAAAAPDAASSPSLSVVAAASAPAAVAALALLTGLMSAVIVRRRKQKSLQLAPLRSSPDSSCGSHPPSKVADSTSHNYSVPDMSSSRDHPYSVLSGPYSQDCEYAIPVRSASPDHLYAVLQEPSSEGHAHKSPH